MVLKKNPIDGLTVIYFDLPKSLRFWKKGHRGLYLYYSIWQYLIFCKVRKLHKQIHFDIVHHLTYGNMLMPMFLSHMDAPLVWGPIGGGELVPKEFRKSLSFRGRFHEYCKDLALAGMRFNPLICHPKNTDAIIAKTKETAHRLGLTSQENITITTDVGAEEERIIAERNLPTDEIRFLCVGRLLYWRGFDLAIQGFAHATKQIPGMHLSIIGDGPEKKRLQNIVAYHAIADRVSFEGTVSRVELKKHMAVSTALLNSCLREGGVTIFHEALNFGLPVISLDVGGATNLIDSECGIKINRGTPKQVIRDIAGAIASLAENPLQGQRLAREGRKRLLEECRWDQKGKLVNRVYQRVLKL